jgi:uncharacterized protein (UPF0264 family)
VTALLASVASAAEAAIAVAAGADIIDLKNPADGALGALPPETIRACLAAVGGWRIASATIGDLPMEPAMVARAARAVAALGPAIVKVGYFAGGDRPGTLDALAAVAAEGVRLVLVLFADDAPDLAIAPALAARGFHGVMIDTADKAGGGLRRHLDDATLGAFIRSARTAGLLTGLAGSLRLEDIRPLGALGPDYLGFRGALCAHGRASGLEAARVRAVATAIADRASTTPTSRFPGPSLCRTRDLSEARFRPSLAGEDGAGGAGDG